MDSYSGNFKDALVANDLAALQKCAKADLHNHAIGGGNRQFIKDKTGKDIAPVSSPLHSMEEMHTWGHENFGEIFEGQSGRLLAYEATFIQAKLDGVTYLDVGEDVWGITVFDDSAIKLTQQFLEVHQRAAPEINWIRQLSISRHCPVSAIQGWMEPFLEMDFFHTFDLSGDELAQPIEVFKPVYRAAKDMGLRLKAHVGEWGTADDVRRAVEVLELDEVQHGIAAAQSPEVMRYLADNKIPLNICPTSNLLLGRVDSLKTHPIRQLYDAGIIVTIAADDVLVFGQGVSEEFLNLHNAGVFTADELDEIRLNGLKGATAALASGHGA